MKTFKKLVVASGLAAAMFLSGSALAADTSISARTSYHHADQNEVEPFYGLQIDDLVKLGNYSFSTYGNGVGARADHNHAAQMFDLGIIHGLQYEINPAEATHYGLRLSIVGNHKASRGFAGNSGWDGSESKSFDEKKSNSNRDSLSTATVPDGGSLIAMFGGAVMLIGLAHRTIR